MAIIMPGGRFYLAVGFDMDGTLLRTDVNYSKLSEVVCGEMMSAGVPGHVLSLKESSKINLDNGMNYLKRNGRSNDLHAVLEKIRKGFNLVENENVVSARPYDGAERMIEYLKDKGYRIGVLTRGGREYATKALTVAGVIGMIDALVCRDDHDETEAKPAPIAMVRLARALGVKAKDILYLGDHRLDYFCARDSGAGFIGVLTRYTREDWASVSNGVDTIGTVAELIGIL
jgi:phosphoglycolate phosphatase